MRIPIPALLLGSAVLIATPVAVERQSPAASKGWRLADLAWPDAERVLTSDAVIVIPLGAGSTEHGPHLKLGNDYRLAEYFAARIVESTAVVVAPTVAYHYYPGLLEYPGSTSLTLDTARNSVVDVVRALARYGPKRFYVLNTSLSTVRALEPAAAALATDGILLRHTAYGDRLGRAARGLSEQTGGSHADEIETSMMLFIDPSSVDMSRAVRDYTPSAGALKLTRTQGGEGTYSASGVWGDPTLATRDKGRVFVEALVAGMGEDIEALRKAALPAGAAPAAMPPPAARAEIPTAPDPAPPRTDPCTGQSMRGILAIGDAYAAAWANASAVRLGELWSETGNIIHADGSVERGAKVITQNRIQLFARPEYRGSRHPITLTLVRCLSDDVAIADGKWELRGLRDAGGRPAPSVQGQVTIVAKRAGEAWKIEAYRYTVAAPK